MFVVNILQIQAQLLLVAINTIKVDMSNLNIMEKILIKRGIMCTKESKGNFFTMDMIQEKSGIIRNNCYGSEEDAEEEERMQELYAEIEEGTVISITETWVFQNSSAK